MVRKASSPTLKSLPMIFNSFAFLFFLTCVLLLYIRSNHLRQNRILMVASYVFYGWWDYRFLSLILLWARWTKGGSHKKRDKSRNRA